MAGVIAWPPACIVSFVMTAWVMSLYADVIIHGAHIVLFWMCVIGTVLALFTGYLLFLPAVLLSYRYGVPTWVATVSLAMLLVWVIPTIVVWLIDGTWRLNNSLTPWCVAPALICCIVFHVHQRWVSDKEPIEE